jgi:hypothetical protein
LIVINYQNPHRERMHLHLFNSNDAYWRKNGPLSKKNLNGRSSHVQTGLFFSAPGPHAVQPMGLGLLVCERNSGPEHAARSTWSRIAISLPLFSFPVFINKSARKKDAVVDRTDLSPKFPLPPHRTNSRSDPDLCRAPPRLTDPAPDPLVARRDLSIGTTFAPSL